MTDEQVHSLFVQWINAEVGVKAIKAHQDGDRPDTPYIMVNMTNVRDVREHEQTIEFEETDTLNSEGKNEIVATPVIETEWEFSVHAYGTNPTAPLRTIRSLSRLVDRQEPLSPNLILRHTGPINIVPEYVKNAWEPRAQMLVRIVGVVRDQGAVVDTIDTTSFDIQQS